VGSYTYAGQVWCRCHDTPCIPERDARLPGGWYYRCAIKKRAKNHKWYRRGGILNYHQREGVRLNADANTEVGS
jgi:hypothetical protein